MDNKYVTVIAGVGVQTILSILQPLINDDGHDYRPSFPHLILSPTNTRSTNLEILLSSEILRHYTLQCCKVNIENRRFYFALHLSLSPSILRVSSSDLSTYIAPSDSESLECLYSWSEHQSRWDEMNSRHSSNRGECGAATYTLRERNPYDVHVYFDEAREPEALELRERIRATFPWMRFHQPHRCPIGPHPCAMWECDFASYENRDRWGEVSSFVAANHGNLSVLIHPHSTEGALADHTQHAFWAGEPLPLRIK